MIDKELITSCDYYDKNKYCNFFPIAINPTNLILDIYCHIKVYRINLNEELILNVMLPKRNFLSSWRLDRSDEI